MQQIGHLKTLGCDLLCMISRSKVQQIGHLKTIGCDLKVKGATNLSSQDHRM